MASQTKAPEAADTAPRLPLFYRDPQPLSSALHANWRLKDGDASFALETPCVPIVVGELAAAARCYPIVFAADDAQPLAVLGLERRNLFVEGDRWAEGYVPAYVRRYPFGIIPTREPEGFALAIDAGSDRVLRGGEEGAALFDDGKPSELTRQALAFCDAFQADVVATRDFAEALKGQDLLIDRRADATLADGRKLALDGFRIVDVGKFAQLGADTIVDWHHRGWTALVHYHLASLERFNDLLARQGTRPAASNPAPASADEAVEPIPAH